MMRKSLPFARSMHFLLGLALAYACADLALCTPQAPTSQEIEKIVDKNTEKLQNGDVNPVLKNGLQAAEDLQKNLAGTDGNLFTTALQQFAMGKADLSLFANVDVRQALTDGANQAQASRAFTAWSGKWYGKWENADVNHNWSPTIVTRFNDQPGLSVGNLDVRVGQYAYIGNGYAWNVVAKPQAGGPSQIYGVVRITDDPNDTYTMGLVGIPVSDNQLIWITTGKIPDGQKNSGQSAPRNGQVYLEQLNRDGTYSISGFDYDLKNGKLVISDGKKATYTRDPNNRPLFQQFALSATITPDGVVPAAPPATPRPAPPPEAPPTPPAATPPTGVPAPSPVPPVTPPVSPGTPGGRTAPGGFGIPPLPACKKSDNDCAIYAQLAAQAQLEAARAQQTLDHVPEMLAEANALDHAANTDRSSAANDFKTAAADEDLSRQAAATAARISDPAAKAGALADAAKYKEQAATERQQGQQAQQRADAEQERAAALRTQANSARALFDAWTKAAAEAQAAYNRCKQLPPCPPPRTSSTGGNSSVGANTPSQSGGRTVASGDANTKPQQPQITIVPANGGSPDSVVRTQSFVIQVRLPPGAETPDQVTVNVDNQDKDFSWSKDVTLTQSSSGSDGTVYVSAPITIDSGKPHLPDWINVDNGGTLTATLTDDASGKPTTTTFQVYNTTLSQAVGRNNQAYSTLKTNLSAVADTALHVIAAADQALATTTDPGARQYWQQRKDDATTAFDLATAKLKVIKLYFQDIHRAPGSDPYLYTDQYKFNLGTALIPLFTTYSDAAGSRSTAALEPGVVTRLFDAATYGTRQELDDIKFQGMNLLALGLYQATAELTLAGPVWTLASPLANAMVSPDAVDGGGTFTGTTYMGTTATRGDYLHAITNLLIAAAMMKGVSVGVDALGDAAVSGYGGPGRIRAGEFVISSGGTSQNSSGYVPIGNEPGGRTATPTETRTLPPEVRANAVVSQAQMQSGLSDLNVRAAWAKTAGADPARVNDILTTATNDVRANAGNAPLQLKLFAEADFNLATLQFEAQNPNAVVITDPAQISMITNVRTMARLEVGGDAQAWTPDQAVTLKQLALNPDAQNIYLAVDPTSDVLTDTAAMGTDVTSEPGIHVALTPNDASNIAAASKMPIKIAPPPMSAGRTSAPPVINSTGANPGPMGAPPRINAPSSTPVDLGIPPKINTPTQQAQAGSGSETFRGDASHTQTFRPGTGTEKYTPADGPQPPAGARTGKGDTQVLQRGENPNAIGTHKDPVTGAAQGQQGVIPLSPVNDPARMQLTPKPTPLGPLEPEAPGKSVPKNTAAAGVSDNPPPDHPPEPWKLPQPQTYPITPDSTPTTKPIFDTSNDAKFALPADPSAGGAAKPADNAVRGGTPTNPPTSNTSPGTTVAVPAPAPSPPPAPPACATGSSGVCVSEPDCTLSNSCLNVRTACTAGSTLAECNTLQPAVTVVQIFISAGPALSLAAPTGHGSAGNPLTGPQRGNAPGHGESRGRLQLASYRVPTRRLAFASGTTDQPVAWPSSAGPAAVSGKVEVSIVANGNSSGEALELRVFDPSGRTKKMAIPEGVVLEPLKPSRAKPASVPGPGVLSEKLIAYCAEFGKLPPEAGTLYRVAGPELQDKFKPLRSVLRAGRELASSGTFHPDSDPAEYADAIRQYSLWAKLENWGEQKFAENFLEHTKKNAQAKNVKWTKQMEQGVLGLVPGRWRDISMVLEEAQKLSSRAAPAGQPKP